MYTMFNDSEYMVVCRNAELTDYFPFDDINDAVVKSVMLVDECPNATVQVGVWNGKELEEPIDITEARVEFNLMHNRT